MGTHQNGTHLTGNQIEGSMAYYLALDMEGHRLGAGHLSTRHEEVKTVELALGINRRAMLGCVLGMENVWRLSIGI